mgnify:CR=1 FL=1
MIGRLRNMFRVPDLRNKILFTLLVIAAYRVGAHIPVPFVNFAAIGYAPRRFEVKRTADQDILVADAKLQVQASTLDAVKVTAPREKVARGDNPADVGGTEKTIFSGRGFEFMGRG